MTMQPTITCAALIEPRADIVSEGATPVGVQLNFELREEPGEGDTPEQAEQAFRDFLGALPKVTFAVYDFSAPGGGSNGGLKRKPEFAATAIDAVPAGASGPIVEWLKDWRQTDPKVKLPWTAQRPKEGELHDPAALSAGQRLAAAQGWVAPLPQQSGLTRMISVTATAAEVVNFYVIPFREGETPPNDIANVEHLSDADVYGLLQFDHPLGWGRIHAAPVLGLAVDQNGTLMIDFTGFLRASADDAEAVALMRRLRERAGSLFWGAPQLAGLAMPREGSPAERGARLVWRAEAALCALFDPLFLSLSMASGARREGPFVAAAATAIVEENSKLFGRIGKEFVEPVSMWVTDQVAQPNLGIFVKLAGDLLERPSLQEVPTDSVGNEWQQDIEKALQEANDLLPWLLAIQGFGGWVWPETLDYAALEARLSGELAGLVSQMGSEGGIEAAVLAFFKHKDHGRAFVEKLFSPAPVELPPETTAEDRAKEVDRIKAEADAKVDAVLTRLTAKLTDNFDGLAAARLAVGSLFAERVPQFDKALKLPLDFGAMYTHIKDSAWFVRRIGLQGSTHNFDGLITYLRNPVAPALDTAGVTKATDQLQAAFAAACEDLIAGLAISQRRFLPESDPPNLPIRLTIDTATGDGDPFDLRYDGIGVLLQRGIEGWRHASLAKLTKRIANGDDFENVGPTILPLLPGSDDGERQLVLEYTGRAFAANDAPPVAKDTNPEEDLFDPYHSHRALTLADHAGYQLLPALAYGTRYQTAAYAVSRSGVLPVGVADGVDWLTPSATPAPPTGTDYIASYDYSRTTGIGRLGLERASDGGAFAAPLKLIEPLSTDYPRIGMTCAMGATRFLDLWRASDGVGALPLPANVDETSHFVLADVEVGGDAPIVVSLRSDPADVGETGGLSLRTADFADRVTLSLKRVAADRVELSVAGKTMELSGTGTHGWVRLAFDKPGAAATIRLAEPTGAIEGAVASSSVSAGTMLVLKPDVKGWSRNFDISASALLRLPAMGRIDMDRWLENSALHAEAAAGQDKLLNDFRADLLTVGLDLDLAKKVESSLTSLPDLAVTGVLVELTVLDVLGNPAKVKDVTLPIPIDKLGIYLKDLAYQPDNLPEFLEKLSIKHAVPVEVVTGSRPDLDFVGGKVVATVPAGHTARLAFGRLVPERYFSGAVPVLAAGLRQHAIGSYTYNAETCLVFDGPSLTVEVMDELTVADDFLAALKVDALSVEAEGMARSYQLQLDPQKLTPAHRLEWRKLGGAQIAEQRWRFLGKPIHNWFAPKRFAHPRRTGNPTAVVWLDDNAPIGPFEIEAFDPEATPQRQLARLMPLGETSTLSFTDWPEPSATVFRHKLAVRNRYAGARTTPILHRVIGQKDWLRVALLAERQRIELTRPQLRALMPLNRSPDLDVAPPLMAMFAERPFAQGGLADRIATGVATGLGYELPADQPLKVGEARQEVGPDPQLSYHPLREDFAVATTLKGDGPIGLTFDSDVAPAPAFPNSAWVLAPEALRKGAGKFDWQEHFVSVTMRRYLDPAWLADPEPDPVDFRFAETLWLEIDGAATIQCGGRPLLIIEQTDGLWMVKIAHSALMPQEKREQQHEEAPASDPIKIVEVDALGIERLALLHQPLEAGRAALSVFALGGDGTDGTGALPRLVAGCEWRTEPASDLALQFAFGLPVSARRTSASAPTAMEWSRTGRNAEKLTVRTAKPGQRWNEALCDAGRLSIVEPETGTTEESVTFALDNVTPAWPCSSLAGAKSPLHVHRVLALLQTDRDSAAGSTETFGECNLVFGRRARFGKIGGNGKVGRLLEIELPARPLGSGGPVEEFKTATFDLGEVETKGCLLMVRPLEVPQTESVQLTAKFRQKTAAFDVDKPASEASRAALVLIAFVDGKTKAWKIDGTGEVGALNESMTPPAQTPDSEFVTLTAKSTAEWWADVSMLTLDGADMPKLPYEFEFDLRWLFGKDDVEIRFALTHSGLRSMVESQARLISVSPPLS